MAMVYYSSKAWMLFLTCELKPIALPLIIKVCGLRTLCDTYIKHSNQNQKYFIKYEGKFTVNNKDGNLCLKKASGV